LGTTKKWFKIFLANDAKVCVGGVNSKKIGIKIGWRSE
jgi:hypothetical protein